MFAALAGGGGDSSGGGDNPLGTVGGLVIDAANQMALPGANVKVISAGVTLTATTTSDGTFSVPKVPAGQFIVAIALPGFTTAQFARVLAGAVGEVPVKNPIATLGPILEADRRLDDPAHQRPAGRRRCAEAGHYNSVSPSFAPRRPPRTG